MEKKRRNDQGVTYRAPMELKKRHIEKIETIIAINQIFFGKNFYTKKAAV